MSLAAFASETKNMNCVISILNQYESSNFTVHQKSVRDHFILLEKEQKKKIREEEKASEIAPVQNDVMTPWLT